jgi:hypothetical protein
MKTKVFLSRREAEMLLLALDRIENDGAKTLLRKARPLYEEFRARRKPKSLRLFLTQPDVAAVRSALRARRKDDVAATILLKIEESQREAKRVSLARARVSLANPIASGRSRRARLTSGRDISPR